MKPPQPPRRVLVVDDHDGYAEMVASVLDAHPGIEVVGRAADGLAAVELASELLPDAIVMDVNMPRLDGFEATRRITRVLPHVRVVIVSGAPQEDHRRRAQESGAVRYLPKDSTIAELAQGLLAGTEERLGVPLTYAIAV